MAVSGLAHFGHSGHGGHGGHVGDTAHLGHAGAATLAMCTWATRTRRMRTPGPRHVTRRARPVSQGVPSCLYSLLSPRVLFSLLVGFGAGGLRRRHHSASRWRAGRRRRSAPPPSRHCSSGPLWRFLFRFESRPRATLESAIEDDARAVTGFDANGCGLVAVDVDGQIVQLLATLAPDDRARGVRVRSGDVVRVAEVDAARGRCTVTAIPTDDSSPPLHLSMSTLIVAAGIVSACSSSCPRSSRRSSATSKQAPSGS